MNKMASGILVIAIIGIVGTLGILYMGSQNLDDTDRSLDLVDNSDDLQKEGRELRIELTESLGIHTP